MGGSGVLAARGRRSTRSASSQNASSPLDTDPSIVDLLLSVPTTEAPGRVLSRLVAVIAFIVAFLISGTAASLLTKVAFQLRGVGAGLDHLFHKPLFITLCTFLGMSIFLPLAYLQDVRKKRTLSPSRKYDNPEAAGGRRSSKMVVHHAFPKPPPSDHLASSNDVEIVLADLAAPPKAAAAAAPFVSLRAAALLAGPALLDVIATVLLHAGLVFINASIAQMMRGSEIVFATLLSVSFLHRRLRRMHYAGIGCCLVGITAVGASSMLATGNRGAVFNSDIKTVMQGIGLILASQAVQAVGLTVEDYLLRDLCMPPLKVVGFVGALGTVVMALVVLPAAAVLPGVEGNGLREDTLDTLRMLGSNPRLLVVVLLTLMSLSGYNLAGMVVTGKLGAVHRTVLETMRTVLLWLAGLVLHYAAGPGAHLGESGSMWSILQAAGFLIMVAGTLVYGYAGTDKHDTQGPSAHDLSMPADMKGERSQAIHFIMASAGASSSESSSTPPPSLTARAGPSRPLKKPAAAVLLGAGCAVAGPEAANPLAGAIVACISTGGRTKRPIFEMAKELGTRMVVIDTPDSWVAELEQEGIIAQFVPFDFDSHEPGSDALVAECSAAATRAAAKLGGRLDGVVTYCELAVSLTARVAKRLCLPGNTPASVDAARDKYQARCTMAQAGLASPRNMPINSPATLAAAARHVGFPAVIKPVSFAASFGVMRVNSMAELSAGYRSLVQGICCSRIVAGAVVEGDCGDDGYAEEPKLLAGRGKGNSNAGSWVKTDIMMEEYLDGPEVDVDVVLSGGEAVYTAVTDNWPTHEPYFLETGSNCPSILPAYQQAELVHLAVASVKAMGLTTGVMHVEGRYTSRGARLIEVNCRMGGGPVRDTNHLVWGVDLAEEMQLAAVGAPSRVPETKVAAPLAHVAEYSVNAQETGTIRDLGALVGLEAHPDVLYARPLVEVGSPVVCAKDGLPTWVCELMVAQHTVEAAIERIHGIVASLHFPIVPAKAAN